MKNVQNLVNDLRELTRMKEEIEAEITAAQDAIKEVMDTEAVDELLGTDYKITWKMVQTSRIDTTALKKALPEIAEQYSKVTTSRRFVVA